MFPVDFGVQRSSALDIEEEIRFLGSRMPLDLFTYSHHVTHVDYSLKEYAPYRFGVKKSQRLSALDIAVKIWFLGSRVLCFPLRDTVCITHMDYP
jgi:hypothetical protein